MVDLEVAALSSCERYKCSHAWPFHGSNYVQMYLFMMLILLYDLFTLFV